MKITKEEIRKLVIKKNRAARRKETRRFKKQIHQDKRTRRIRTKREGNNKAIKESND